MRVTQPFGGQVLHSGTAANTSCAKTGPRFRMSSDIIIFMYVCMLSYITYKYIYIYKYLYSLGA